MAGTRVNPRLLHFAGLAVVIAVIAWCIAMCGPSNDTASNGRKPTVSATPRSPSPSAAALPPAPPPPPPAKDYVEGMVESVSGGTVGLRTRSGSATVDFSPSTPVFQVSPAALTDVTPGSCVNVRATPQSTPTDATAAVVTITSSVDGKCPPPPGFYGTVASVSGNTIAVNGIGPGGQSSPTNVTVNDSTSYKKQTASNTQAIVNGTCMGAQGTNDGGALQAMTISLEQCPPMGGHHHLHIPHLPHLPHLHL